MPTQRKGALSQPKRRRPTGPREPAPRDVIGAHRLAVKLITTSHAPRPEAQPGVVRLNRKLLEDPRIRHLLQGASIGPARPRSRESAENCPPGSPVLRLYVNRPATREEMGELLHEVYGVRQFRAKSLPFEVIPVPPASFLGNQDRLRPAAAGVSCSNLRGGLAGTLGFFARGRQDGQIYLVGNNHILANVNRGRVNDPIVQPAVLDGGGGSDVIARLYNWVTLNPAGDNVVDCAAAVVTDQNGVIGKMVQHVPGDPGPSYFTVGAQPAPAGPRLGKCGRTTEVKAGRLVATNATLIVSFEGRTYVFHDQLEIADESVPFCDDGDSGSLVWNFDAERRPVGLLCARMGDHTYANPIAQVLDALNVDVIRSP